MKLGDILNKIYEINQRVNLINQKRNDKLKPKYLNIGAGQFVRKQWQVLDLTKSEHYNHKSELIDYNIDLEKRKKWDIKNNFFEHIYSSHTLEHLTIESVKHTLKESYRILKPNGTIRIVVPDNDLALIHYKKNDKKWFDNVYGSKINETIEEDLRYFSKSYYMVKKPHNGLHKTSFCFKKLESLLKEAGFRDIVKSECGKSQVTELCFLDGVHSQMSMYLEGLK